MTMEEKIDKIIDAQNEMNSTLVRQEANLKEHMRRTELLEKEVKPIVKHIAAVKGVGVFMALLSTIAAVWKGFFA